MNLRDDDILEGTYAPAGASAAKRRPDTLDNILPFVLKRDFIQLLLQSPHRLYLYWTFARDPHATLREAFGELAAHYRLAVRLVKVDSGEEFLLDASQERAQWFEVHPRNVYRADIGFHSEGRPFVRLLSSNEVQTPPDSASHLSDEAQEFKLEAVEFTRLLIAAGYERYARGLAHNADGVNDQVGGAAVTRERQDASGHIRRETADEYPHR